VIAAAVAVSTMLGNAVVDYFARLCGKRTTLLLWAAAVQSVAGVGIGLAPDFPTALICLLIVTGTMGVVGPVRQAYLHQRVPGEQRATVVSFVLAIPLFLGVRLLREDADRIVGRAGRRSPCAAQGLASVGALDDKPRTAEAAA
jgi:MFS family permease